MISRNDATMPSAPVKIPREHFEIWKLPNVVGIDVNLMKFSKMFEPWVDEWLVLTLCNLNISSYG